MYCLYVIFVLICAVNSENLTQYLLEHFQSDNVKMTRDAWASFRSSLEQVITHMLQTSTGKDVKYSVPYKDKWNKNGGLRLATGYFLDHDPVQIILKNLDLIHLPQLWLPEVSISLASNVVKIETKLSKMIITASYKILRNQSEIINDVKKQNSYTSSPFLFQPVHNMGKIGLSVEGCILSGYIIATLNHKSVKLGHHKFSLTGCDYTVEIYQPNDMSPPIIAPFSTKKLRKGGLEIKHLLLKPIGDEVIEKLQGILFRFISTKEIFDKHLTAIQDKQTEAFSKTLNKLTDTVRELNLRVDRKTISLDDFCVTWDDLMPNNLNLLVNAKNFNESIMFVNMSLTGLDTAFLSQTGGPYKLEDVMIGERIRYSSLQVRGFVQYSLRTKDTYKFSVELSDYDFDIDYALGTRKIVIETVGVRKVSFSQPSIFIGDAKEMLTSHLINEISSIIHNHLTVLSRDYPPAIPLLAEDKPKGKHSEENGDDSDILVETKLRESLKN